jgi:hypothetical protein
MKLSKKHRHYAPRVSHMGVTNHNHPGGRPNSSGMSSQAFFNLFGKLWSKLGHGDQRRFYTHELERQNKEREA